jgi:hypothetical protein
MASRPNGIMVKSGRNKNRARFFLAQKAPPPFQGGGWGAVIERSGGAGQIGNPTKK